MNKFSTIVWTVRRLAKLLIMDAAVSFHRSRILRFLNVDDEVSRRAIESCSTMTSGTRARFLLPAKRLVYALVHASEE